MQMQSPLSNLSDVLAQTSTAARVYATSLKSNEAATRAALVDPVLRALGWNVGNPNMVEVEKTLTNSTQSRIDYALYDMNGTIRIIIEAKSLGQSLSAHAQQLVQYAFAFQVTNLFLTNGNEWHHYTDFSPGHFVPSKSVNLATDNLVEIAAFFVRELDAANFWPDQPDIDMMAQDINQLRSDLLTLQQQIAHLNIGTGSVVKPLPAGPNWTELSKIDNATKTRPSMLRLPDGSQVPVKYWKDVLVIVCKFVLANAPNISVPLPDRSGKTVKLFDDSRPPKGIAFISDVYNGQSIYIHTNYSAENHIANSLYILTHLPVTNTGAEVAVIYTSS